MDRATKAAVIEEVAGQISESEAVFAVDYRGISVPQAAELRTRLRETDATFRVTKNTLTERAADQADAPGLKDFLQGPTAMTFVRGDAAAAAKALADFNRTSWLLTFKGGWMNGAPLTADQVVAISRLPSREVLLISLGLFGAGFAASDTMVTKVIPDVFGVRAIVWVPEHANAVKVASIRGLGAEIVEHGRDFDDAREHCEALAAEHGYRYIHSGNEPHLIAGVHSQSAFSQK